MKHVKTYKQLNEAKRSHDDAVEDAESFLEDFITSLSEDDDYGSMSYKSGRPREGEYTLDSDDTDVWAEFAPKESTYKKLIHQLDTDYENCDLVKKFKAAAKEKRYTVEILSTDDNTISLTVKEV